MTFRSTRAFPALPALLVVAALLSACGFRPLYGQRAAGEVSADLSQVRIDLISDRSGQILHNYLRDRMNPGGQPADPTHRLSVTLTEDFDTLGIRKDETATRANFRASASYQLIELGDLNETVMDDRTQTITSYNIVESEFATISARDDARERALRLLADKIAAQVALHFNRERERGDD